MDRALLIDALVRRFADLIADLSLGEPTPVSLAHVPDLLFQSLDARIRGAHDKPQRVAADLFGLPLRTYQHRLNVTAQSATVRGMTVWEAVYRYIREEGPVGRGALELRFRREDQAQLRSILKNMVQSGLVFSAGRGGSTLYQANLRVLFEDGADPELDAHLVWVAAYNQPGSTLEELSRGLGIERSVIQLERLRNAVEWLVQRGRLIGEDDAEGTRYRSRDFVLPPPADAAPGHAALYDHFTVIVDAICDRLRHQRDGTRPEGPIGGATYRFDLYPDGARGGDAALGLLSRFRAECSALRESIDAARGAGRANRRVVFYFGQSIEETIEPHLHPTPAFGGEVEPPPD